MANTKSYTLLAAFIAAFVLFMVVVGGHVTAKLKAHKAEMQCVQKMLGYGHPRSMIEYRNGACTIKPLQ